MTQQIKVFCDVCGKECQPEDGRGNLSGAILRLTTKMEKFPYRFQWDICKDCMEVVLNFINELKNDITRGTNTGAEPNQQSDSEKK